jgi:hypothetical protein
MNEITMTDAAMADINDLLGLSKPPPNDRKDLKDEKKPVSSVEPTGKYGECATCVVSHKPAPAWTLLEPPVDDVEIVGYQIGRLDISSSASDNRGRLLSLAERSGAAGLCLPNCASCGGFGGCKKRR